MDYKYNDDEMGSHNNFDILALCDLVEDYRIEIVNASEELSILATELSGAHVVIEAHKNDLVVSNALIIELEESICVLDDELVDMRDFVVTIMTLLSIQASDTDVVDGLRSILRIDREGLVSDSSIDEIGLKVKLPGGENAVINRYKNVITSQLSEITALKEKIKLLDPNSDKDILSHLKECSPAQECINSFEERGEKKGILKFIVSAPTGVRRTRYSETDDICDNGLRDSEEVETKNSGDDPSQRTFSAESSSSCSQDKNIIIRNLLCSKSERSEASDEISDIDNLDIRAQNKTDPGGNASNGLAGNDYLNIPDRDKRRVKLKEREMRSSIEGERSKERRGISRDDKNAYMQLEIDRDNAWRQEDGIDIIGIDTGLSGIMISPRRGTRGKSAVNTALSRVRSSNVKGSMGGTGTGTGHDSETKSSSNNSEGAANNNHYSNEVFNSIRSRNLLLLSKNAPKEDDIRTQEQQHLHNVWLGTAVNSPPRKRNVDGDEKSQSVDETASLSEPSSIRSSSNSSSVTNTVRFSRPIHFSHPVLRSDCEGIFFDRDDLRHSDSRNYSHNSDYRSRAITSSAEINKIVSETLNKENNKDILRRKTRY